MLSLYLFFLTAIREIIVSLFFGSSGAYCKNLRNFLMSLNISGLITKSLEYSGLTIFLTLTIVSARAIFSYCTSLLTFLSSERISLKIAQFLSTNEKNIYCDAINSSFPNLFQLCFDCF